MDVDANKVIEKLGDQIKQMSASIAIKDVQIETLQQELTKLNADKWCYFNKPGSSLLQYVLHCLC